MAESPVQPGQEEMILPAVALSTVTYNVASLLLLVVGAEGREQGGRLRSDRRWHTQTLLQTRVCGRGQVLGVAAFPGK